MTRSSCDSGVTWRPTASVWTVPVMRGGRARLKIGAMAHGNAGACLEDFLARPEIRARLLGDPPRPVRRLLPSSPSPAPGLDRVLVVGDAGASPSRRPAGNLL